MDIRTKNNTGNVARGCHQYIYITNRWVLQKCTQSLVFQFPIPPDIIYLVWIPNLSSFSQVCSLQYFPDN